MITNEFFLGDSDFTVYDRHSKFTLQVVPDPVNGGYKVFSNNTYFRIIKSTDPDGMQSRIKAAEADIKLLQLAMDNLNRELEIYRKKKGDQ